MARSARQAPRSSALVVEVKDGLGRPVTDQDVTFRSGGSGQIAPATDAPTRRPRVGYLDAGAGCRSATGASPGHRQRAPTELRVSFTATAVAGSGSTLVLESGDGQSGAVGSALDDPLVVRVVDPLGNPVSGQTVTWTVIGGGSIDPTSSVTGNDGIASAERVLGPTSGTQSALATAAGLAGLTGDLHPHRRRLDPDSLVMVSGDDQTAPAGFQLPDSLVVRLLDVNGNGVGGRTVAWVVRPGRRRRAPINSQTDPEGFAVTRWTLGAAAGSYTLNAVFSGLTSISFSATATADVPTAMAVVSGNAQSAAVGTMLPNPLRVRVTDANGNGVENVSVTWAAIGGGSVSSHDRHRREGHRRGRRTLGPRPEPMRRALP